MATFHTLHGSRPPLSSQQSSSVPSTPHQRARHDFELRSRSPSPRGLNGRHSPRSVVSDASRSSISKISKVGRPICKYETSYAMSRRRMQYDIGDAPLDNPKEEPKKSLDPDEDEKLSGDMRELYDRLEPSDDSAERRQLLVKKLEKILNKEYPGNDFSVVMFGSSGNKLCTSDSDLDICIVTGMKTLESMHMLASTLDNNGMERVVCVPAKVPIVKIWDPEFQLAADLNVNNPAALENTRMIKVYVDIDERVRPLAMIIKYWSKQRILNDAGIGGTLSSYAWICLIINFLQTRKPPILPSLHQRTRNKSNGPLPEVSFDDDVQAMRKFGSKNKSSIGQLLFQFFRYYSFEFPYDESVVSVRQGRVLSRVEKGWTSTSKDGQWKFCIEEPFNISRNLGNSADSTAFRGIHLEIRRAFMHLSKLELEKMVEKYEFPAEEKPIFKRPPATKAVLSAGPPPNSNKAKGNMRSNRNNGARGGPVGAGFRRASSGATYGRTSNSMPYLTSPVPLSSDFLSAEGFPNIQWAQNWQMMAQVQSHAAAHAHSVVQGSGNSRDMASPSAAQMQRAYSAAPSPLMNGNFYPLMYPFAVDQAQPMMQSTSLDGAAVRSSPASPSLTAAVPTRRGIQRASVSNGSPGGSIRSQSQPGARGLENPMMPIPIAYDASGLPVYSIPTMDQTYRGFSSMSAPGVPALDPRHPDYSQYYYHDAFRTAQGQAPSNVDVGLPRAPSHPDLAQRRERVQQPLVLNSNKASRSPSPGSHGRHDSSGLRSAPATASRFTQMNNSQPPTASNLSNALPLSGEGLLIVNGSYPPSQDTDDSRTEFPGPVGAPSPPELQNGNYFSDGSQEVAFPDYVAAYQEATSAMHAGGYPMPADVSSTLASPTQPFPAFDHNLPVMPPLAVQEEEMVMSPKTAMKPPWQSFNAPPPPMASSSAAPKSKENKDQSRPPASKSISHLSTVIETRTPSPSSNRKPENNKPSLSYSHVANGSISVLDSRALPVPPTPLAQETGHRQAQHQHRPSVPVQAPSAANPSPWQQQTSSKKRHNNSRKRAKSGPTTKSDATASKTGEKLPPREEDRKGG